MNLLRLKLRIEVCVLAAAINVSPLWAENPLQPKSNETTSPTFANSLVGSSILSVLPKAGATANAAFQGGAGGDGGKVTPPGRTYGTVIVLLAVAGGAVAAALVLSNRTSKQSTPSNPGTFVTAGPPTINPTASH